MLVLSRKQGEQVLIGENIWLTVVEIGTNRVRLGFTAPVETLILREELHSVKASSDGRAAWRFGWRQKLRLECLEKRRAEGSNPTLD
jgi:carbon storage regulator